MFFPSNSCGHPHCRREFVASLFAVLITSKLYHTFYSATVTFVTLSIWQMSYGYTHLWNISQSVGPDIVKNITMSVLCSKKIDYRSFPLLRVAFPSTFPRAFATNLSFTWYNPYGPITELPTFGKAGFLHRGCLGRQGLSVYYYTTILKFCQVPILELPRFYFRTLTRKLWKFLGRRYVSIIAHN